MPKGQYQRKPKESASDHVATLQVVAGPTEMHFSENPLLGGAPAPAVSWQVVGKQPKHSNVHVTGPHARRAGIPSYSVHYTLNGEQFHCTGFMSKDAADAYKSMLEQA